MTYLHYRSNGDMVDDVAFLDAHGPYGVGQYDASWERIEAEWFMSAATDGVKKVEKHPGGGFAVAFAPVARGGSSAWISFPRVHNVLANRRANVSGKSKTITFGIVENGRRCDSGNIAPDTTDLIEVRVGAGAGAAATGIVIASCTIPTCAGPVLGKEPRVEPSAVTNVSCALSPAPPGGDAATDLTFVYHAVASRTSAEGTSVEGPTGVPLELDYWRIHD
jgi:hypothetical protein